MPKPKQKEAENQTGATAEAVTETVRQIPLSDLHPFEGHPFKVLDDDSMAETVESIRQVGVANPLIVRPDPDGGYEIISGHRRHHAAELAGLDSLPVIVRELDDDAAVIMMVDSNIQRETILPSEKALAYKMKLDAIKHQGRRTDLTSSQPGMKLQALDLVGAEAGDSRNHVHRYIRLTNLTPEEQRSFLEAMDYAQAAPSVSQAQRMKKKSQEGGCTLDDMCGIMDEVKKDDLGQVAFKTSDLQKYFPKSYTPKQMSDTILRLLEQWQRRRQRDQER